MFILLSAEPDVVRKDLHTATLRSLSSQLVARAPDPLVEAPQPLSPRPVEQSCALELLGRRSVVRELLDVQHVQDRCDVASVMVVLGGG